MKRVSTVAMTVCLTWLVPTCLHARVTLEYMRWTVGIFDVPPEIKKATTISDLQSFLSSKREFTRMCAARRLGEIGEAQVISQLLDVFEKEEPKRGIESFPLVKLEVVRTLGRIGTDQSKSALLRILKMYWQEGPRVKNKKDYLLDMDFACVMPAVLRTLGSWSQDSDVFKMVENIALSNDVRDFYRRPYSLGQAAWEVYLKCKITREGISKEEDSAKFILDFINNLRGQLSYGTLEYIKYRAAFAVLQECDRAFLSSLAEKLEKELAEEEASTPAGVVSERNVRLRSNISCIKAALKEKTRYENLRQKQKSSLNK
jgi:hypothetical protein